jgi:hypothetical protein
LRDETTVSFPERRNPVMMFDTTILLLIVKFWLKVALIVMGWSFLHSFGVS